jgi:group I intron endonuclease
MVIYKVTNKINGKIYIGKTLKSIDIRKKQHLYNRSKLKHITFYKALNKYHPKNFKWEIIKECNNETNLNYYEKYYISLFDSVKRGYNDSYGGEGSSGRICKEETREKISEKNKGNIAWNKGHNKETDDRIFFYSKALIGHEVSKSTRKKMSNSAKKRANTEKHKIHFINMMKSDDVNKKRKNTIIKNGSFKNNNNPRWNKDINLNEVKKYLDNGYSIHKISNILNYPQTTLYRRIKKWRNNEIREIRTT